MTDHDILTLLHDAATDVDVPPYPAADVLASGRVIRRRRSLRVATLAGTGVAAVVLSAVVLPPLVGAGPQPPSSAPEVATRPTEEPAAETTLPEPQPREPDRPITVAAADIPQTVASFLPDGELGGIVRDETHPLVETERERVVHFRWNGALTTVVIGPANTLASCEELAESGRCEVVNGLETLIWPGKASPGTRTHGVEVWQHGYVISLTSYDAPDGKNPEGSEDVASVLDGPAIGIDLLTEIASSQVWFD
jgi:hypothetical protein